MTKKDFEGQAITWTQFPILGEVLMLHNYIDDFRGTPISALLKYHVGKGQHTGQLIIIPAIEENEKIFNDMLKADDRLN